MKARVKARVKATGEIVEVVFNGFYYESIKDERIFDKSELEIIPKTKGPDYWTRLEHTYAGMAMQGMMNNSYLAGEFRKDPNNGIEDMSKIITKAAAVYARALVEKYKKEE